MNKKVAALIVLFLTASLSFLIAMDGGGGGSSSAGPIATSAGCMPTEEEVREYWDAQLYSGQVGCSRIFALLNKYGSRIVNQKHANRATLVELATMYRMSGGWPIDRFEKLLQVPDIDLDADALNYALGWLIVAKKDLMKKDEERERWESKNKAIWQENYECQLKKVELLIRYGARVNDRDSHGDHPLIEAAKSNLPEAVSLLLAGGSRSDGHEFFNYARKYPGVQRAYDEHIKSELASWLQGFNL